MLTAQRVCDMKTIDERANAYCENCRNRHEFCRATEEDKDNCLIYSAYIAGCGEQRLLDDEQLCEMILDNQNAIIDKACEWLKEFANFSVNDNTGSLDEQDLVERFKQAMKGE